MYPILLFLMDKDVAELDLSTNWSQFSLSYTCLILLGIVLLMTAPRETSYIQKVNAFGVVFIVIFLVYVVFNGVKAMTDTSFVYSQAAFDEALVAEPDTYTAFVPIAGA